LSVLRSWRFVIEPEQGFFDSGVYVRFLRSRSGQKNRCGGHHSFPILRDTGPEANRALAAEQSGASPGRYTGASCAERR